MDRQAATRAVKNAALALGFVRVGVTRVERFREAGQSLGRWLDAGYHGEMEYLEKANRADPGELLPHARSLVIAALPTARPSQLITLRRKGVGEANGSGLIGSVAAYAVGADYHRVVKDKLRMLADAFAAELGHPLKWRACVDTAPLLEREAARRAGIGFTGKSTMTVTPGLGTYLLLGELLVDIDLEPDEPIQEGCGRCTACLDACPTGAFVAPYLLDARRCISYLTIEHRGVIPRHLREPIGTRVFGCDICQDACPYNASPASRPSAAELAPAAELEAPDLVRLLELTSSGYRRLVRRTALTRVSRQRLARNAAVALGNTGDRRAVAPLARALSENKSALVRRHAAWALGRLGGETARRALDRASADDPDPGVREEAAAALAPRSVNPVTNHR